MNSTAYANRAISPFMHFNSQRIELFHIPAGRYKCSGRSFNSQRDGILLIPEARGNLFLKFQFPTGWNSTTTPKIAYSYCGVSIPNGMKFYRAVFLASQKFQLVSIPNGMEFYQNQRNYERKRRCFNSQRDGILPNAILLNSTRFQFQFPTGWNSTLIRNKSSIMLNAFQLPTGWNSTILLFTS